MQIQALLQAQLRAGRQLQAHHQSPFQQALLLPPLVLPY
jgi:hypothetical protein